MPAGPLEARVAICEMGMMDSDVPYRVWETMPGA